MRREAEQAAGQLQQALLSAGCGAAESGWHVEVVPSPLFYCGTRHRCIVLTTAAIAACWQQPDHEPRSDAGQMRSSSSLEPGQQPALAHSPRAALLFLLGHELAHGLAQHTAEKAVQYSARMLLFCWRYILAERRFWAASTLGRQSTARLGCVDRGSGGGSSQLQSAAAELKLQVAAGLQQLSWQHEREADALACHLLAAAGVPPQHWADGLAVLQRMTADEQQAVGEPSPPCSALVEGAAAAAAAEEEEAAAYHAAAGRLAAEASALLASGDTEAAQQLLDGILRWPLPAGWLMGLAAEQQAALLSCAMRSHPPLAARAAWVQELAARRP
ncbi:hypothetical protein ABPG75_008811 [Micractinium tetrahymenae]